jgi:hypothetical protein
MKNLFSWFLLVVTGTLFSQNTATVTSFSPGAGSTALPGMGFKGVVVAKFQQPVLNLSGKDVYVAEASAMAPRRWPERVKVYFSQDGCNWVYSTEITQSDSVEIRGAFNKIQWVKLVDSSDPNFPWNEAAPDGFDLVSITADNSTSPGNFSTPLVPMYPRFVTYSQGLRNDGLPVEAARSNATNSLLAPQNVDQGYNFFSLGIGGWAIYSFEFAIFDKPGIDLTIVETSWGSPSCSRWPERVTVEGANSPAGPYFYLGQICLDGSIDISGSGIDGFHYVRLTDRSPSTAFNGDGDGYDVDGLIATQQCPMQSNVIAARESEVTESSEPEYFIIKNFYGDVLKEGEGKPNTEGLKPGAYVLEFTTSGVRGRKMLIVQPE